MSRYLLRVIVVLLAQAFTSLFANDVTTRLPGPGQVPISHEVVGPNCAFKGYYRLLIDSVTFVHGDNDNRIETPMCTASVQKVLTGFSHTPWPDQICTDQQIDQQCIDLCKADEKCAYKLDLASRRPSLLTEYPNQFRTDFYPAPGKTCEESLATAKSLRGIEREPYYEETTETAEENLYGPLDPIPSATTAKDRILSTYPTMAYTNYPLPVTSLSCNEIPKPSTLACPRDFENAVDTMLRPACRIMPAFLGLYKDPLAPQPIANPNAPTTGKHFVAIDRKYDSGGRFESARHTCRYMYDCRNSFVLKSWDPQPTFDYIYNPKMEINVYHGSFCRAYGGWTGTAAGTFCAERNKTIGAEIFPTEIQNLVLDIFPEDYVNRQPAQYPTFTTNVETQCALQTGAPGADVNDPSYTPRSVREAQAAEKCYEYARTVYNSKPDDYAPPVYVGCCRRNAVE